MKNKVISAISAQRIIGIQPENVTELVFDSRKVKSGSVFFAITGTLTDGHKYIDTAIEKGAVVIVCQTLPLQLNPELCYIEVVDSSIALAEAAAAFYDHPSRRLKLVGVTGTNGKTTTATLLHHLFTKLGYKVGLLSTVVNKVGEINVPATHTTPDQIELNDLLNQMVESGCDYCFMEVSSHSIVQHRIHGLYFCGGIFTNLTHDHLDYHGTFRDYLNAKKGFFDSLPKEAFALTNADDKNGDVMLQNSAARKRDYSLRSLADYHCRIKESHLDGTLLEINGTEIWVQFIGRFNAYNLTAIYGAAIELGADKDDVLTIMSTMQPVDGRFECIRSGDGRLAIVDYAHTPDALENVLRTISELKGGGKVYTVVGCGGDRDVTKRPIMAQIAVEMSDMTILTSDNPRTENPDSILAQMREGLDPVQVRKSITIGDRREAIRTALRLATDGDVILIAGKGHESYQEVNGVRSHFDDREEVRREFAI